MQNPIFSAPLSAMFAGAVLSLAATGAMAQTTTPPTNPTTIGVTPQDSAEATRKAVPRADTGTVVRTDESAADKTRNAADSARTATPLTRTTPAATSSAPLNTTTPMNSSTTQPAATPDTMPAANVGSSSDMNDGAARSNTRKPQRRARADRN